MPIMWTFRLPIQERASRPATSHKFSSPSSQRRVNWEPASASTSPNASSKTIAEQSMSRPAPTERRLSSASHFRLKGGEPNLPAPSFSPKDARIENWELSYDELTNSPVT